MFPTISVVEPASAASGVETTRGWAETPAIPVVEPASAASGVETTLRWAAGGRQVGGGSPSVVEPASAASGVETTLRWAAAGAGGSRSARIDPSVVEPASAASGGETHAPVGGSRAQVGRLPVVEPASAASGVETTRGWAETPPPVVESRAQRASETTVWRVSISPLRWSSPRAQRAASRPRSGGPAGRGASNIARRADRLSGHRHPDAADEPAQQPSAPPVRSSPATGPLPSLQPRETGQLVGQTRTPRNHRDHHQHRTRLPQSPTRPTTPTRRSSRRWSRRWSRHGLAALARLDHREGTRLDQREGTRLDQRRSSRLDRRTSLARARVDRPRPRTTSRRRLDRDHPGRAARRLRLRVLTKACQRRRELR